MRLFRSKRSESTTVRCCPVPRFSRRLSGTKSRVLKFLGWFLIAIRRIAAFAVGLDAPIAALPRPHPARSSAGMMALMQLLQSFARHVRINGRRRNVRVAEQ